MDDFVRWCDEIDLADIPLVGGKNASLGEMNQNLEVDGAIDCPVMVWWYKFPKSLQATGNASQGR